MAERITTEESAFSIAKMPCDVFWTRDDSLTLEQIDRQAFAFREMPVRGTEYLLEDGESFLRAVPYRWRN